MASIYRRTRSYPIPSGAEISERRRKATAAELLKDPQLKTIVERWAKWVDKKGRTRKALVNADGDKVVVESGSYLISYYDADGIRQEVNSKTTDLATAERIAGQLENQAALCQAGIIDAKAERYAKEARRPLGEHLAEFRQYLTDKQNTAKHVELVCARVGKLVDDCKAERFADLTDAAVMAAIGAMKAGGASLQTCNHYIRGIKQFSRWLKLQKRTPDDALAALAGFNAETDRRYVRRELTPEEMAYLLRAVESYTTPNHNMAGPDRAMAYRVALGTGFRAKELRSLTPASFALDAEPPTVTVTAGYSKRRRQDVQPIRPDLAELLRPWLAKYGRDEHPFAKMPERTARMLQDDLEEARRWWLNEAKTDRERADRERSDFLKHIDADGRVLDFHGTRHTYISGIVAGGASVKTAQELARHSTPNLTIGRYAHARLHDLTAALAALPDMQPQNSKPGVLEATGTDGSGPNMPANRQQYSRETAQNAAGSCEPDKNSRNEDEQPNVLPYVTLSDKRQEAAGQEERGAGGSRTHEWRFCKPLP